MNYLRKDGHLSAEEKDFYLGADGHITALKDGKRYITSFGGIAKADIKKEYTLAEAVLMMLNNGGTVSFEAQGDFAPLAEDGSGERSYIKKLYSLYAPFETVFNKCHGTRAGNGYMIQNATGYFYDSSVSASTFVVIANDIHNPDSFNASGNTMISLVAGTYRQKVNGAYCTATDIRNIQYIPTYTDK